MAGIGISLNRIFKKNTLGTDLYGFAYSTISTVAPMFAVIGAIIISQMILHFETVSYASRELFADTILYMFIFSLLCASPFNAVLSRYLSDTIFEERYEDIRPCYFLGLLLNVVLGCLLGIPFCVREYVVGGVPLYYVFTGYAGFMGLLLVFYSMLYLSITKDYRRISLFFAIGMAAAVLLSLVLHHVLGFDASYALLLSMAIGFLMIASLEVGLINSYFRESSGNYRGVLAYMRQYPSLIIANFLYTLGLFVHNFVFWTAPDHLVLVGSFVTNMTYDMATCLAMFTNISATVIFISEVEMHFHERYKAYSEAVIGGRRHDIENAKRMMFLQLRAQLMDLVRIQFIITVAVYFVVSLVMPHVFLDGELLRVYPALAGGYFILFVMYAEMLYLYYFNDTKGAVLMSLVFALVTLLGALWSMHLPQILHGLGLVLGAAAGFTVGYLRLQWIERNLDTHIFCRGSILRRGYGHKPDSYWRVPRE